MGTDNQEKLALILTGGGARAAYQVGALKYMGEKFPKLRFQILVGSSAGAINMGVLATQHGDIRLGSQVLERVWGEQIRLGTVFRSDFLGLAKMIGRWIFDLVTGGLVGRPQAHALLDTGPLRKTLERHIDTSAIAHAIQKKSFECLAIAATEISSGSAVFFVQGDNWKPWRRSRHRAEAARIGPEHILASAAIPVVFPSVLVGKRQYVDGSVRSVAPFRPAARLGATKIFGISVRSLKDDEGSAKPQAEPREPEPQPTIAALGGLILNSLFYDSLDADADHLTRINEMVRDLKRLDPVGTNQAGMREIDVFLLRPSDDLGRIARDHYKSLPFLFRFLLRGIGTKKTSSSDILSYLLFERVYTKRLIELGYKDASKQHQQMAQFLGQE